MENLIFDTWKEASLEAKQIAETYDCTIKLRRTEAGFSIEVPYEVDQAREAEAEIASDEAKDYYEQHKEDLSFEQYMRDNEYEHEERMREIGEERSSIVDGIGRSQEEGWYYDDSDPD